MDGETEPTTARAHLNRGIAAHAAQDLATAREAITKALVLDPEDETAWLWMAELCDTPSERLYCLNRAVKLNPDTPGRRERDRLNDIVEAATTPQLLLDLDAPPLPPGYRDEPAPRKRFSVRLPQRLTRHLRPKKHQVSPAPKKTPAKAPAPNRRWVTAVVVIGLLVTIMSSAILIMQPDYRNDLTLAVVGPMTGPDSDIGETMRNGATIAASDFNRTTKGPRIHLVFFDDAGKPETAKKVAQTIVARSDIVGVVGHGDSATSLAAAPIYEAAGIPAITAQATADGLSAYPSYFRTIFADSVEGELLATYIWDVFQQSTVSIVTGEGEYEQSLADRYQEAFITKGGTVTHRWTITDADTPGSVNQIVSELRNAPDHGMVVLALSEKHAYQFLLVGRRAGLASIPMLGSEAIGSDRFASLFANEPEEQVNPGFFTDELYVASPLIFDAVGADTLAFEQRYINRFDEEPGWRAAKIWDAVMAFAIAGRRGEIQPGSSDARSRMIAALRAIDSEDTSFRGLSGPFYFTANGNSLQGFSIGQFYDRVLSSAPTQYRVVTNTTQYDMAAEVAAGRAFEVQGYYVRQYRIVYVGVEMIELRSLDITQQAFLADFFLAFRYNGDDAALDVVFPNATQANLTLGKPVSTSTTKGGMHYAYFRVQGTFNVPMDFQDYPWDTHQLPIRIQNPHLTQNDIVYVIDPTSQAIPMEQRLTSSFDSSQPFNNIPNWTASSIIYAQASVTTTDDNFDTVGFVQFSEFRILITIERDVQAYLVKTLLPLALLSLVTYIALWFPAEQASARVGFAITALLSSSVMLNTISGQLPDIGYTVAIEWGYYVYIGLSAATVLLTIAVDRSYRAKRMTRGRRIDAVMRTLYPLTILGTVFIYWWVYYA